MMLFMYDYFQLKQIEEKEEEAELMATEMEGLKVRTNSAASLDKCKYNYDEIPGCLFER